MAGGAGFCSYLAYVCVIGKDLDFESIADDDLND
jgi:hypothetical protein